MCLIMQSLVEQIEGGRWIAMMQGQLSCVCNLHNAKKVFNHKFFVNLIKLIEIVFHSWTEKFFTIHLAKIDLISVEWTSGEDLMKWHLE